ncbi:hypothetical protein [Nocardia sp. NPDC127526]|uniref:hypothetical protein n=1 Tax=Nocardia sp. NPDC127526 TaxID=3345393 RepID=UPI003635D7F5
MDGNSGHILTLAEIDREIEARERDIAAIASTLVDLDKHPGLVQLRSFPPIGVTEERWAAARSALESMWEDFGRLRTILDRAHETRKRRRPDALDREELTGLLRGRPLEVARTTIPLVQRSLMGPRHQVEYVGFAEMVTRMHTAFPTIAKVLDAVATVNHRVMSELQPMRSELERSGTGIPQLRTLADDIDALIRQSALDPLSLRTEEIDRRIAELAARMTAAATLRAELSALAVDWGGAVDGLRARVELLRRTYERADHARVEVERTVLAGPLPRHADDSALFGAELTALQANPPAPAALLDLRRRVEAALATAQRNAELAQGLLDRRMELRGRLSAYRAKAARLGVGEDRDVRATYRIAAGLLTRKPCDLAAVTRAVTDYRQLIAQRSGRRP